MSSAAERVERRRLSTSPRSPQEAARARGASAKVSAAADVEDLKSIDRGEPLSLEPSEDESSLDTTEGADSQT